ncbi:MAG: hypothetical protein ABI898_10350 [Sphingomonadales bacterium]
MTSSFDDLYCQLRGRPDNADTAHWEGLHETGRTLIREANAAGDGDAANKAWHLALVSLARAEMCRLFEKMRGNDYRAAWPLLEQVEKMVQALQTNSILGDDFAIAELGTMISRWQSLYPYTVFASPEMIIRRQECTICGEVVSPLSPCGHLPGKVYSGEICSRKITDCEVISIALVRDPVQKYSVLIPKEDPHDYMQVRFAVERVSGPFTPWMIQKCTALHDHSLFGGWNREDHCPCHSGNRYSDCCAKLSGVRMPHIQFLFTEPISGEQPALVVRKRENANGKFEDVVVA